jgi:hypothetical protein
MSNSVSASFAASGVLTTIASNPAHLKTRLRDIGSKTSLPTNSKYVETNSVMARDSYQSGKAQL